MKYKSILITGGTGSFGKAFLELLLTKYKNFSRIVIFSRDEFKQFELSNTEIVKKNKKRIRFFIGDIRDKERLEYAFNGIDVVVHAAALKQVESSEYNPTEVIKTNINGAQNIIDAAIKTNVKSVIALSTDKAVSPINLYGASKLCSDKLFIAANNVKGKRNIKFSVARYGNVLGSRGSVIPYFLKLKKDKKNFFPITHRDMTRFWISMNEALEMIVWLIKNQKGGEILIPKIPSSRITDLAKAIDPNKKHKIIGVKKGEKIHETLISKDDGFNTIELGKYYLVLADKKMFSLYKNCKRLKNNFSFSSDKNHFLNIKDIKKKISKIQFMNSNEYD